MQAVATQMQYEKICRCLLAQGAHRCSPCDASTGGTLWQKRNMMEVACMCSYLPLSRCGAQPPIPSKLFMGQPRIARVMPLLGSLMGRY